MTLDRFAYFLLADAGPLSDLRDETCAIFPEHVTVRGRFLAPRSSMAALAAVGRAVFAALPQLTPTFIGPASPREGLVWFEVSREDSGYSTLRQAHIDLHEALQGLIAIDETSPEHTIEYYRPHLTLSFAGAKPSAHAPRAAAVLLNEWALVRYVDTPTGFDIRCVYAERLARPGVRSHKRLPLRSPASVGARLA